MSHSNGMPVASKSDLKKYSSRMKRNPTPSEVAFKAKLDLAGIRYHEQKPVGFFIADFVIPSKNLIVEIDGSAHIGRERYDSMRDDFIKDAGFKIIRIKNEDVAAYDVSAILEMRDICHNSYEKSCRKAGLKKRRICKSKGYNITSSMKRNARAMLGIESDKPVTWDDIQEYKVKRKEKKQRRIDLAVERDRRGFKSVEEMRKHDFMQQWRQNNPSSRSATVDRVWNLG